jgi:hypothetical protein
MLKVSQAIDGFLAEFANEHNMDLIERVRKHGTGLELQVNVSPKGGELVDGTVSTYTDGCNRWHSFRIPKGSYADPHWQDFTLRFPLEKHVDAIGSTGWLWTSKLSLWVAFDIDSILGHAEGVGISDTELLKVREAVSTLEYVEVRKSTSGKGLHLYVFLPEGITTNNHGEHAAVARAVLSQISQDVGFDMGTNIDVCGSNTWFWARRATVANEGFKLLKAAKGVFPHSLANWRDHLPVVRRTRARVSIGIAEKDEDIFEQMASAHQKIPLDAKHLAIRDGLMGLRGTTIWVQDHHLLQTHTSLLKMLKETSNLDIVGVFETNSAGTNVNQPNCFMFPLKDGAWRVTRFGAGTAEHASWTQDGKGWTTCIYNRRPSLEAASLVNGGQELSKGGYEFDMLRDAVRVIKDDVAGDPNLNISLPDKLSTRKAIVKKSPTGQIIIEVPASKDDPVMPGWNSSDKKGFWTQLVKVDANPRSSDTLSGDYDKVLRCLETVESQPAGWTVAKDNESWMRKSPSAVKTVLQALGHVKPEAECVMGGAELQPWKLVTVPFAPEYPGDRQWNLEAPQLAVLPAPPNDDEESQHPHWDMILEHVGSSLTKRLRQEEWAQEAGIITGQQYLQAWYANVLRHPFSPLPYLFLYGPENSGKSIFHEAFSLLVTSGVVKADQALTSQFNSELEGCILAVVEEKNVATTKGAHEKIKDAVTSDVISIRRMRTDVYQVRNTTHWVQCSNNIEACPIFNGDSRITVIHVPEITKEIPKERLKQALIEEAPFFLRTLLNMTLPPPTSRLRLPLVNTDEKIAIIAGNQTVIEAFIEEMCEVRKGSEMLYADFYDALQQYPGGAEISRQKLSRELCVMRGISVRAGAQNKRFIIGLSLKPQKEKKS